jgi:integrase/recombinase XerD
MLLLIATYGLRRSEVSCLEIGDIQWRARTIRVPRPKVGTPLVVPLTDEVATALVEYLRQRAGEASERRVFLRVRAPQGPIQPTAVFDVFDFWAVRAGVRAPGLGGPHVLRHGLAMPPAATLRRLTESTPLTSTLPVSLNIRTSRVTSALPSPVTFSA